MEHFRMDLELVAPADRVYAAIVTPEKWWTRFANVSCEEGGVSEFRFPADGFFAAMKNLRLEPGRLVEWECVRQVHPPDSGFRQRSEWEGTRIRFEIEPAGERKCRLHFEHLGLCPNLDCYRACDDAWQTYIISLRQLIEAGSGRPYDDDSEDRIEL